MARVDGCRWAPCHVLNWCNGVCQHDERLTASSMIELQQLTAAFDPLTADTEGVKTALIISPSGADLLAAAASVRLLAVSHTHCPRCHATQPASRRHMHGLSCNLVIHWFRISDSALISVK